MSICSIVDIMDQKLPPTLDEHTAAHVAELFRAFSDTSRVRILSALTVRELNVGALAELIGISESAVSHHLRSLRQMGLVETRREGKEVFYRIEDEHIIVLFNQGVGHARQG
jgi:ArsR family transcriptional regulator